MTILLLKGYNNYFNRIVKREADITAYKTASTSYLEYANVNFDPQDGIMTSIIVGGDTQKKTETVNNVETTKILDFESGGSPDYFIVHENNVIESRWFIVECVRVRAGQYKLALKRDVLVDFNDQIMNSPCFVEKGTISDPNDVLLLNSEGMSFNQQKQDEVVLRDKTNCAWLVGYLKKDMNTAQTITHTFPTDAPGAVALSGFDWANCVNFKNLDGSQSSALKVAATFNGDKSTCKFRVNYKDSKGWDYNLRESFTLAGNLLSVYSAGVNSDWEGLDSVAAYMDHHGKGNGRLGYAIMERVGTELFDHTFHWDYITNYFNILVDSTKYSIVSGNNLNVTSDDLMSYNGTLVTYNSKLYKLTIGQGSEKSYDTYYTGEDNIANDYISMLYYQVDTHGIYDGEFTVQRNQDNPTKKKVKITLTYRQYNITAEEVPYGTATFVLPVSSQRNDCEDAVYDMFAMPVSPSCLGLSSATETNTVIRTPGAEIGDFADGTGIIFLDNASGYQLAIAQELVTKLGAGNNAGYVYDLQLLPYCPFNLTDSQLYVKDSGYGILMGDNIIDLTNFGTKDYTLITRTDVVEGQTVNTPVGIVFYPPKANFATSIAYSNKDYTEHYEWLTIEKPTLLSQGREGDYTRYRFADFPYTVTDGTWDIGPNNNNPNVDVEITGTINDEPFTNDDCSYISLYVSPSALGGRRPALNIASSELPLQEANDYSTKITVNFTIKVRAHWVLPDRPLDIKVKNECDFYRLTSPNYNSFYEFKKTKLDDGIKEIKVVCTYKPYNPYIKINPDLNGSLYSKEWYNDNIGLMLAGDYSIPMISDAFVNYELNNRNYQALFNRQIQNLDVNQRIAKEQQQFQGIVGAIAAPVTGALAGAATGAKAGPYGAIAGAVIGAAGGGVLGGVGYAKDMEWLQQQQHEARDFAVDQFQYQLGNIQALPQSMTKSTPLSHNNKVWPVLEYFSCTDREKDLLREKIKYNGMTIMAVGKLIDYATAGGYLKGKMIRLLDLGDDSHIAQAIYEEVDKGFYEGEQ